MPIAGVVADREVLAPFAGSVPYFNTFGGSHIAIAAARAVLDVLDDEGLPENARTVGAAFRGMLRELADRQPLVGDVRGDGLFVGVELLAAPGGVEPGTALAARVVNGLRRRRVLTSVCGRSGNVLKVRPPLVFTRAQAERFTEALEATLRDEDGDR
jgi:4-aminobutyrate aminotransferase-like enzyme